MGDVVELNEVVPADAVAEAPDPAHGDAGIRKIPDGVVGDMALVPVTQQDAAGGKVPLAAALNEVFRH